MTARATRPAALARRFAPEIALIVILAILPAISATIALLVNGAIRR